MSTMAAGDKLDISLTDIDVASDAFKALKVGSILEMRQGEDVLDFLDSSGTHVGSAPISSSMFFGDLKLVDCRVRTIRRIVQVIQM